jgi:hypothetical protein
MAQDLPRYINQGQIQPGPLVSSAPVWDQVSKIFGQFEVQGAKEWGAAAGQQPGFQPIALPGAAGQAFNQAALQANKFFVGADISKHMQELNAAYSQNIHGNQSVSNYAQALNSYANQALSKIPAQNQPYARLMIQHLGARGLQDVQKKVTAQNNAVVSQHLHDEYQTYYNEMGNAARRGDQKLAGFYYQQIHQGLETGAQSGIMKPMEVEKYKQAAQKEFNVQHALGGFESLLTNPNDNPDALMKYKDDFMNSKALDKVLSPEEREGVLRQMNALQKGRMRELGIGAAQLTQMSKNALTQAEAAGKVDPQLEATLEQNMSPAQWQEYQVNKGLAINRGTSLNEHRFDSIDTMKSEIANLKQPATAEEAKSPHVANIVASRFQLSNQLHKALAAFQADPAGTTRQDPTYQRMADQIDTNIISADPGTPGYATQTLQAAQKKDSLLLSLEQQRGLPKKDLGLLSQGEMSNVMNQIMQAPTLDDGSEMIQSLGARYGQNFGTVMNQMMKAGLPMYYQIIPGLEQFPDSAPHLSSIKMGLSPEMVKEVNNKVVPADRTEIKQNVLVQSTPWLQTLTDPTQKLAYTNAIAQYASYLYYQGQYGMGGNETFADAAQKAYQQIIGNRYQGFGATYRVPKYYVDDQGKLTPFNGEDVQSAMNIFQDRLNQQNLADVQAANPAFRGVPLTSFGDEMRLGHWVSMANDSGYKFVSRSNNVQLRDASGQPIQFTMKDIYDNPHLASIVSRETSSRSFGKRAARTFLSTILPLGVTEDVNKVFNLESNMRSD